MKLKFVKKHLSVGGINEIDIPDFTIITGLNGSGKTNFLKSIEKGCISVDDIPNKLIKYYNPSRFQVSKMGSQSGEAIKLEASTVMDFMSGKSDHEGGNYFRISQRIFEGIFDVKDDKNLEFWAEREGPEEVKLYEEEMEKYVFSHPAFNQYPGSEALKEFLKERRRPIHTLNKSEIYGNFRYVKKESDIVKYNLSNLFTKYKVDAFLWVHSAFEAGDERNIKDLYKFYHKNFKPPWVYMNEIFAMMHDRGNGEIFNFELTTPDDASLTLDNFEFYKFSAEIVDKTDRSVRDFDNLSSGEKLLLALSISVFAIESEYGWPKLFLLDEVDASLHPSMTKALIETLEEYFIDRGISVILATHSPSTVALSPSESIHVITKRGDELLITKEARGEAIQALTQGYMAIDRDASILKLIQIGKLAILTEGKNRIILRKLLEINGVEDVVVLGGAEHMTGKDQIKTFYDLIRTIGHIGKVLCVWDCDCESQYGDLPEDETIYTYVIPINKNNDLVKKGIENAFPKRIFSGFTEVSSAGSEYFNARKKRRIFEICL